MPGTVTANGLIVSHKGSSSFAAASIPDVCKTPSPVGPVPVPYPNMAQSATTANGTTTVKADGMMIGNMGSEYSLSNGDEPGVAGGVVSSTFIKEAKWITVSFDVKAEGQGVGRFSDKKTMNHANTVSL